MSRRPPRRGRDAPAGPAPRPYSAPRYYEIAFDMNRKQEVDFLEHCFRTYGGGPSARCSTSPAGRGPT